MALFIRNFRKNILDTFTIIGKDYGRCSSELKFSVNNINRIVPRRRQSCTNFDGRHITLKRVGDNYKEDSNSSIHFMYGMAFIPTGIFSFFKKKDENEESELVMTIKRGVLLIQKGEFKKAEQMLHLALKMAQEQQNQDGITYIYDLLANLALEQQEYKKAEALFVNVMQRLVAQGVPQTDNRIVHMSLKLANIFMAERDTSKAEEGYKFCTKTLKANIEQGTTDEDTILLYAMANDMYARFLVEHSRVAEAFTCFNKAYESNLQVHGELHEETVVLLNDLGTLCIVQDEYDKAIAYLSQAVSIGDKLPEMKDFVYVLANLVAAYIKKGMYEEAKTFCVRAWQNAKKNNNEEVLKELTMFFDEIKQNETKEQQEPQHEENLVL